MIMQVYQIDAWRNEDKTWRYNNSMHICDVEVKTPTKRTILKALREANLLRQESIYQVDDYFTFEGWWNVQLRNGMPLYDMLETV